ncbi:MAG: hypothetical protein RMJ48_19160 [Roseiflexaceae bacterium]|nr:hypothetical protein [Roseiflexaceae bacterium]
MNQEQVLRDLMALPPEAQRLAADFIALLRLRYTRESSEERNVLTDSKDTHFIGMWSDRADMADSTVWTRITRLREWG